jgi:8-oxo-dGTP pyrophosphatase MutT (NUDIX family)
MYTYALDLFFDKLICMNESHYFRVSVKGIVVDEQGRFLLSREDNGKWDMLGGGLGHEENPIEGLKREVFEETGLEVIWMSRAPKYFITSPSFGGEGYVANVVYEMKLKNLDFTPSEESQELRFFTAEEASEVDLFPTAKKLVAMFDRELHRLS